MLEFRCYFFRVVYELSVEYNKCRLDTNMKSILCEILLVNFLARFAEMRQSILSISSKFCKFDQFQCGFNELANSTHTPHVEFLI